MDERKKEVIVSVDVFPVLGNFQEEGVKIVVTTSKSCEGAAYAFANYTGKELYSIVEQMKMMATNKLVGLCPYQQDFVDQKLWEGNYGTMSEKQKIEGMLALSKAVCQSRGN